MNRYLALVVGFAVSVVPGSAQVVDLNLMGVGGAGLLGSNEVPAVTGGGTGGEIGAGISYNQTTNVLTLNIGWGSGNAFTDLTSTVTGAHIHGATASTGTAAFGETAGVAFDLGAFLNTSPTNGSVVGTVNLTEAQEAQLLNNQFYINIHTGTNGGGEIRGNLVPVPEPTLTIALAAGTIAGVRLVRRRFRPVVATA